MTSAYLSVVSHDDQLHILGRSLGMAFMLQGVNERKCTGNRWVQRRKDIGERWGRGGKRQGGKKVVVNGRGNRRFK